MKITDFDYHLPEELIAQKPADKRDCSRLLVVHRDSGKTEHKHFYDILEYLRPGDLMVLNNSKVLPARLFGVKEETGAKVEFLLIKRISGDDWETMVRPGRRLKPGDRVVFSEHPLLKAEITGYGDDGTRIARFEYDGIFMERLEEVGSMPLPPYIQRESIEDDKDRYQTVYCRDEGSVAAPTAGLHFTKELLAAAEAKGVELVYVTLHVGIGTFRPVKVDNIEEHSMHFEEYSIDANSAAAINRAKREGRRIISVGTTSTRTVESAAFYDEEAGCMQVKAGEGSTGIFIYPGYDFKIVDSLIT
ncbi:MAG: tRNA preQ1(34) S-adenosylmethionine ribosyltransferase-isomerase QueA, partial [Firmicutes bacterium]|nr:tRNA preQ1(34) S-adenosylmethionine ribosyltransferase-isomerase QueA [Bacillota bacterium]